MVLGVVVWKQSRWNLRDLWSDPCSNWHGSLRLALCKMSHAATTATHLLLPNCSEEGLQNSLLKLCNLQGSEHLRYIYIYICIYASAPLRLWHARRRIFRCLVVFQNFLWNYWERERETAAFEPHCCSFPSWAHTSWSLKGRTLSTCPNPPNLGVNKRVRCALPRFFSWAAYDVKHLMLGHARVNSHSLWTSIKQTKSVCNSWQTDKEKCDTR